MGLSEADTRAKLIDPALYGRGRTEDFIRREVTAGASEAIESEPRDQAKDLIYSSLRSGVNINAQTISLALLCVKPPDFSTTSSLKKPKLYDLLEGPGNHPHSSQQRYRNLGVKTSTEVWT
jgi:hypothetical protein